MRGLFIKKNGAPEIGQKSWLQEPVNLINSRTQQSSPLVYEANTHFVKNQVLLIQAREV